MIDLAEYEQRGDLDAPFGLTKKTNARRRTLSASGTRCIAMCLA